MSNDNLKSDPRDLYISKVIKASPETVWRCWAEEDLLEKWWTPKPVITKISQMKFAPGGVFGTDIVMPNGDVHPSVGNRPLVLTMVPAPMKTHLSHI